MRLLFFFTLFIYLLPFLQLYIAQVRVLPFLFPFFFLTFVFVFEFL